MRHDYVADAFRDLLNTFAQETLCWQCSGGYGITTPRCPHCGASNGNVDPDRATKEGHETLPR